MYPSPENPDQTDPRYGRRHAPLSGPRSASVPLSAPLAPLAAEVRPASGRQAPGMPPVSGLPPVSGMAPVSGLPSASGFETVSPADEQRARIRDDLEGLRLRASVAASWLETSSHYAQLVNRDGVVPVTARLSREDLMFLGEARGQMLRFAELALRLIELHQPGDAGGLSTHPSSPILRCRSCMWRWPCPTFSIVTEVLD
jgi:hypothetical protein